MRVVLTGSSSGIGLAIATRLLDHGHDVCGIARSDQAPLATRYHDNFFPSSCDVGDWTQVDGVARELAVRWPHVDAVITCAGLQGAIGPTRAIDPIHWSQTVRVNLDGTLYAIRAFFELLARAPRRAKIVCFSGGGATNPRPNFSAYGAAKTGVVRLVETIACEESNSPLDINAVAPGAINTRLTDEVVALGPAVVGAEEHAAAVRQKATGGASLESVLDLVEWLLSPTSDGISGRLISAPWDPWKRLPGVAADLRTSDIYTLRRIVPADRDRVWSST